MSDFESTKHPHEPEIAPVYDDEGRCWVCIEITLRHENERLRASYGWLDERFPIVRDEANRLGAENDVLRSALALLVRLKDGPRDDTYEAAKPLAWQAAREVLDRTG